MLASQGFGRHRTVTAETPVELRFVDLLLIIIAMVMFIAVLLSLVSVSTRLSQAGIAPHQITAGTTPQSPPSPQTSPLHVHSNVSLLEEATAGTPYTHQFSVDSSQEAPQWTVDPGSLPKGLRLTPEGLLTGTPTTAGEKDFKVTVTDDNTGVSATQAVHLKVDSAPPSFLENLFFRTLRVLWYLILAAMILFGGAFPGIITLIRSKLARR